MRNTILKAHNNMRYTVVVILFILLQGCSNRGVYESLRNNQKIQCQSLPPSQYYECMEQVSGSYEEYTRQREEAIEEK